MSKKSRTTVQPIAGELVDSLQQTEGAVAVSLETTADGRQAFRWAVPIRGKEPYVPCRWPIEIFEHVYGVHEWHIESSKPTGQHVQSSEPTGQQGELF